MAPRLDRTGLGGLKRRGLLAAVAAMAAGGLARLAGTEPAAATHSPGTGVPGADTIALHIDQQNTGTATTRLTAPSTSVLEVINSRTPGPGVGGGTAITARTDIGHGVVASSRDADAVNATSTNSIAVRGLAGSSYGVWGQAVGGVGVRGIAQSGFGVVGTSNSSAGVNGFSESSFGIYGSSNGNIGIYGTSAVSYGVYGTSANSVGVYGTSGSNSGVVGQSSSGVGVFGISGSSFAGQFVGPVIVQGNFTVTGGAKSAAVSHPDGSQRRVYCQESPEAWFEDFGTATLQNGRAEVTLDPDFNAVVKGDNYLVFPVAEGDCNGLYVSRKGPNRFVIEELKGGKSTLPITYRVVARRRDDVGRRLEKVQMPKIARAQDLPAPPSVPKLPELPTAPESSRPGR